MDYAFEMALVFHRCEEFFGFGEVFEVGETEGVEESLGGAVEHWASEDFGAAGDFDELTVHECADDVAAGDASDVFEFGACDGLTVGDDGECFELGSGEAGASAGAVHCCDDGGEVWERHDAVACGDALDAEGAVC